MSEVISISSTSMTSSAVDVKPSYVPSSFAKSNPVEQRIAVEHLDSWLCGKPSTKVTQTKFNIDRTKRYEYRVCFCGCSYRLTLIHQHGFVLVKETIVPVDHDQSNVNDSDNIRIIPEVLEHIDVLARRNLFTPNFGALKVSVTCLLSSFIYYVSL